MSAYMDWEHAEKSVTEILLDARNPRLPPTEKPLGQRELIAELVAHEDVLELARDIVAVGWWPLERLIVVEEDGKTVVVEGNRRLCALKLLNNPDLAPDPKKFRLKGDHGAPAAIPVAVAPSREDAAPYIMLKHTRGQISPWEPLMKARFYRTLADDGYTPDEIARRSGGVASEVAAALRLERMYEVACRLDLPKEVADVVRNPRVFKASQLERLLEYADARELMGLSFEDASVIVRGDRDVFRTVYADVITDIAKDNVHSRNVNTAQQAKAYIERIVSRAPKAKTKGSFDVEELLDAGRKSVAPPAPAKPKNRAPTKRTKVVPPGYRIGIAHRRITAVFDELKRLDVQRFPNASAVMLRILLELAVDEYLKRSGRHAEMMTRLRAEKPSRGKGWGPSLEDMLRELLTDPTFTPHPMAFKRLEKMQSKRFDEVKDLNEFVHSNYASPLPDHLFSLWDTYEPIFDVVLKDPVPSPPKP